MKKILKKAFAIALSVVMLLGTTNGFAINIAEGNNDETIYFALQYYNKDEDTIVTEVAANEKFCVFVNFYNNPSVAEDSMQGYNLLFGYNPAKVSFTYGENSYEGVEHDPSQLIMEYAEGVAQVQGLANGGIVNKGQVVKEGTLFKLYFTASEALTEAELKEISLVKTTGISGKEDTYVLDGNASDDGAGGVIPAGEFNIVELPALVSVKVDANKKIYKSATPEKVKEAITSLTLMDASGASTTYTSADAQWIDLAIELPQGGLVVGKNTVTADFNGYTHDFEIDAKEDSLEKIELDTVLVEKDYVAYDKFDKSGLKVTAVYESGATKDVTADSVVDTTTPLKVADMQWAVTYSGQTAYIDISVEKKLIDMPMETEKTLTYTGETQNFAYSEVDTDFVSVTGNTSGKNVSAYGATATLLDKVNTEWEMGGTYDVTLSWSIVPAEIALASATIADKVFNGETEDAEVTAVAFEGLQGTDTLALADCDVVSTVYENANAADEVGVVVTVALKDTVKNYVLAYASTDAATGKITQAPAPTVTAPAAQTLLSSNGVDGAKDYTINLANILTGVPANAGNVTYVVKTPATYATSSVDGAVLNLNVAAAQAAGTQDAIELTVSSTNYADADVIVNFEFKDKHDVKAALTLANINTTYGEAYTVAGAYAGHDYDAACWSYVYEGVEISGAPYGSSDEQPTKAGSYTVTATYEDDIMEDGIPGHIGTVTADIEIAQKEIADTDFTFDLEAKEYNGNAIEPTVESALIAGTDYDVAYANNTNAGTAKITITGKGNYTGEVVKNFTIAKKTLDESFAVSGYAQAYTYTGEAIAPTMLVNWKGKDLLADVDYGVAYANNTNAGEATVTITGKGNFAGERVVNYIINPAEYVGTVTITADAEPTAVDTVLTANAPAGDVKTYQWYRDGAAIENATAVNYTVVEEDADKAIRVKVKSEGNYVGVLASTSIVIGKSVLTGTVTLTEAEGVITAAVTGAPAEENYKLVWLRDGVAIAGATGDAYTITENDKGSAISANIVALGDVYTGVVSGNVIEVPAEAPSNVNVTATAGNASITVIYSAKANGAAILNYEIIVDGAVVATVTANTTSYTITGLTNDTAYAVQVAAINAVGRTESAEVSTTPSVPVGTGGGGGGGGDSSTNSSAITSTSTTGGKITSNISKARPGSKVTVKVDCEEGYKLSKLIVKDKKGEKIEITVQGDLVTFIMPSSAVSIEAEFEKIEETDERDEPIIEPETGKFNDVAKTAYYFDAVNWAVEKGITSGTSEDSFSPDNECSRAQMITFLWRAAGSPKATRENPFADVSKDAYYYDAVLWALENNITSGVSADAFAPNATVSRSQTVTFLWRLAGQPSSDKANPFADVSADAYYNGAVAWAADANLTYGVSDTHFGVNDACARAQIVTFIYRYFVK